jgi:hypothetical protein
LLLFTNRPDQNFVRPHVTLGRERLVTFILTDIIMAIEYHARDIQSSNDCYYRVTVIVQIGENLANRYDLYSIRANARPGKVRKMKAAVKRDLLRSADRD